MQLAVISWAVEQHRGIKALIADFVLCLHTDKAKEDHLPFTSKSVSEYQQKGLHYHLYSE